jgi:hypothetical protein
MRKAAYVFFFLILIAVIVVMIAGNPLSLFNPQSQATDAKVDVGFILLDQPDQMQKVSFEDSSLNIYTLGFDPEAPSAEKTAEQIAETTYIQMIRGYDVDATGNATSWLFVVRQPDQISLVTFDRFGEKVSAWQGTYPEKAINISQIVTPRELFATNHDTIFPTPDVVSAESRELALAEDTYYLTITGQGTTRYLVFDAKTGALTSSND